ncbi:hypothetical protein BLOT_009012 [Blomia tropicalis]|nr:hypothetical protein BLOT_009012 [Blomia tropicalis]
MNDVGPVFDRKVSSPFRRRYHKDEVCRLWLEGAAAAAAASDGGGGGGGDGDDESSRKFKGCKCRTSPSDKDITVTDLDYTHSYILAWDSIAHQVMRDIQIYLIKHIEEKK